MEDIGRKNIEIGNDSESKCFKDQQTLNLKNYCEDGNKTELKCLKREEKHISLAPSVLQVNSCSVPYTDLSNESPCVLKTREELSEKTNFIFNQDECNQIQTDANLYYNNSAEFIFETLRDKKHISKDFKDRTSYIRCETRDTEGQGPTTFKITDLPNTDRENCIEHSSDFVIPDASSLLTVSTRSRNMSSWTQRKELKVCLQRIDGTEEHIRELPGRKEKVERNRSCNLQPEDHSIERNNRSRKREEHQKTVEDFSSINLSVRVILTDCLKSRRAQPHYKLYRVSNIEEAQYGSASAHSICEKAVSNFSAIQNRKDSLLSKQGHEDNLDQINRKKRKLPENRMPNEQNSNTHRETDSSTSNSDSVAFRDNQEKIEEYADTQRKKVNTRNENFFTCNICFEGFSDNSDYIAHQKTHIDYKFKCSKCCILFKCYEELLKHKRISHRRCKDCGSLFYSLITLETHSCPHRNKTNLTCDVCSESFEQNDDLVSHCRSHSQHKYRCAECPEAFEEEQLLILHKCVQKLSCVCIVCNKSFESRFKLEQHKKQHSKKRLIRCRHCKAKFAGKGNLKRHMKLHAEERFNCAYCMRSYTTKELLERHISNFHFKEDIICNVCNHSFKHRSALNKHMTVHSEKTYKCTNCAKLFKSEESLISHSRVHKSEIICEICEKPFATKRELELHIRTHTGFKPFRCFKCGKRFTQNSNLKTHMKGVHGNIKPFECNFCTSKFKLKQSMKDHIRNVHFKMHVKCGICDELFANRDVLLGHMTTMHIINYAKCEECGMVVKKRNLKDHKTLQHPTNERQKFTCNECNRNFSSKQYLITHLKLHTGEKDYTCKECGAEFTQICHLRSHSFVHSKKRRFSCDNCGKGFSLKTSLASHCMQHLNQRAFECKICGKRYNIKSVLQTHMKSNHTNKESWNFSCTECGRRFYTKTLLTNHIASHNNIRAFKCNVCGSTYKYKNGLFAHMATHSAVNTFRCNFCGNIYKSKAMLYVHITTHLTLRAFQCSLCPKTFKRKDDLKRHLSTHTTEYAFECDRCGKLFKTPYSLHKHIRRHKKSKKLG